MLPRIVPDWLFQSKKMMGPIPVIAVVENDRPLTEALARLLRAQGLGVRTFHSAEMFLAGADRAGIDCLLLDIDLDGMSGLELQRRLRSVRDALPIIFITGRDDAHARERAFAAGCDGYLCKPFDSGQLNGALGAVFGARWQRR